MREEEEVTEGEVWRFRYGGWDTSITPSEAKTSVAAEAACAKHGRVVARRFGRRFGRRSHHASNKFGKHWCTYRLDVTVRLSSRGTVATCLHLAPWVSFLFVFFPPEFDWKGVTRKHPNRRLLLYLGIKLINPVTSQVKTPCRFRRLFLNSSGIDWHHCTRPLFCSSVRACGTQRIHAKMFVQDQIGCRASIAWDVLYLLWPVCNSRIFTANTFSSINRSTRTAIVCQGFHALLELVVPLVYTSSTHNVLAKKIIPNFQMSRLLRFESSQNHIIRLLKNFQSC